MHAIIVRHRRRWFIVVLVARTANRFSGERRMVLETGFLDRAGAEAAAREWRRDFAEDGERAAGWDATP